MDDGNSWAYLALDGGTVITTKYQLLMHLFPIIETGLKQ